MGDDESLEGVGLDSLSLITFAQRLGARCGRPVSVEELQAADSISAVLASFARGGAEEARAAAAAAAAPTAAGAAAEAAAARPRVLCLHGFRSNRDMLSLQLAPYLARHRGAYDFVFADAPRPATGDPEEGIPPEVRTYELELNPSPNPNPHPTLILTPTLTLTRCALTSGGARRAWRTTTRGRRASTDSIPHWLTS